VFVTVFIVGWKKWSCLWSKVQDIYVYRVRRFIYRGMRFSWACGLLGSDFVLSCTCIYSWEGKGKVKFTLEQSRGGVEV